MSDAVIITLIICVTIIVCAYFGNNNDDKNLAIVESYIEEHNLQAKIELYGARCENMCDKGPNIEINGEIINNLTEEKLLEELRKLS